MMEGLPSDEELMRRCKQGDAHSFELLFERHQKAIISFVFRVTGCLEASEDIFQKTFLKVFQDRRRYQYPRKFSTWLYTIARNHTINYLKERKSAIVSLSSPLSHKYGKSQGFSETIEDEKQVSPPEAIEKKEAVRKLSSAIDSLPLDEREVLVLREYQGLSYREISEITGPPEGTLRYKMHQALIHLKDFLEKTP
jgi:RNA polymerase sigma-70 factor (ECF subfamily)